MAQPPSAAETAAAAAAAAAAAGGQPVGAMPGSLPQTPTGFVLNMGGKPKSAKRRPAGLPPLVPAAAPAPPPPLVEELQRRGGLGKMVFNEEVVGCTHDDLEEDSPDPLGEGFYGKVWLMRHKTLGAKFAVKKISDSMEKTQRAQLLTDLEVIQRAHCPHIVTYFGFHFTEGLVWIVMEHMRESLDKMYLAVKAKDAFIPEEVMGVIAVSVLSGLEYLQRVHDVMHRDVKPSNILIGFDGRVKLCDFGIAKVMDNCKSTNTFVGCRPYLPPERIDYRTSRESYDLRNDVWAYGLTLAELALLKYPYAGLDSPMPLELMASIVDGDPPRVPTDRYSELLASYVALCLQKDKRKRPYYTEPPDDDSSQPCLMKHTFVEQHRNSSFDVGSWCHGIHS